MNIVSDIDQATFEKISRLVYENAGIKLTQKKKALVQSRITKRMRQLGFSKFDAYYQFVKKDGGQNELVKLLDAISTNVTHFYREKAHFEFLEPVLKDWEHAGQRRFRIWCAAASSGEEPYTIAITASEAIGNLSDTKILATDISTQVLAKAQKGEYTAKCVETVPAQLRSKYFKAIGRGDEKRYVVNSNLKQMIKFGRLNLAQFPFPLRGPLDVVFCRNVMIYFDNAMRRSVLEQFLNLLKPGGYLIVGLSESLAGLTDHFTRIQPSVYQKK